MSHFDLLGLLCADPDIRRQEYFAALRQCELYYLHFDEREPSVIAAFYHDHAGPELLCSLGAAPDHNTVSFFISFQDVQEFEMEGWSYIQASLFSLDVACDGLLEVNASGQDTNFSFVCSRMTVNRVKTYKA